MRSLDWQTSIPRLPEVGRVQQVGYLQGQVGQEHLARVGRAQSEARPPQVKKGEGPEAIRDDPSRHPPRLTDSEHEEHPPAGGKRGRRRSGPERAAAEADGTALTHLDVTV